MSYRQGEKGACAVMFSAIIEASDCYGSAIAPIASPYGVFWGYTGD